MKKIKVNKELFKEITSNDVIEKFNEEFKLENSNETPYFINVLKNFIEETQQIDFNEIVNYLNNRSDLILKNSVWNINQCEKCYRIINNKYQKSIQINFNPLLMPNFCNCDKPDKMFNENIFIINMNFIIFNVINRIWIWWFHINNIHTFLKDNSTKDLNTKSLVNYEINSLLTDIYSSIDSLKFQILITHENTFLDELLVNKSYFNDNKKKIKNIQCEKKDFINLIKDIQKKLNIENNNFENLIEKLNLINLNNDPSKIKWLIDERNNISHNFINICHGNYIDIGNFLENKRLRIIMLLFIDFVLLFYVILFSLDYLN